MEPSEPVPPSNVDAPRSSSRPKWPITTILEQLRELNAVELADIEQHIKRVRSARGDRPSPELVSQVVALARRLHLTHACYVPISLFRTSFADVPRTLLDLALFDAESRDLLRMVPVQLPAPFIEIGAGIPHERGLLYWIVPASP